jgi:hypothetical protein
MPSQLLSMKTRILSIVLVTSTMIYSAIAGTIPFKDYSKLIIGSWEAGKYSFTFSPNGTFTRETGPVEPDSNKIEGTWKITKDSLILGDFPSKIHFKDRNNFSWDIGLHHWDASRENPR